MIKSFPLYFFNFNCSVFSGRKFKIIAFLLLFSAFSFAQQASIVADHSLKEEQKINDSIPSLIPKHKNGKYGFINQKGKTVIPLEYINVGFFSEDCNLLNSPNEKVRKFGSKKYASVSNSKHDFRIDDKGKKVYQFKKADLGKCSQNYAQQKYKGYHLRELYGVIDDATFKNPENYKNFKIYPQYQYLHILIGDDLKNPMIIVTKNDKFGVVDINNKVIIPFEYADIKRNYSWKLARMFEVTRDGKHYFLVDAQNKAY